MSLAFARRLVPAFSLSVVLTLAGCGGGGGGGTPPANAGPTATITAPANGTVTSATSVVVTGTASDTDGVTAVTVAGVAATSGNGFATWTATVNLVAGANVINVNATDALANTRTNAASITVTRDNTAPTVAVVFPPAPSLTTGNSVTVRGTAVDNIAVSGVTVGGVAATSTDGFATWTASVPVAAFAGAVTAVATNGAAQTSADATVPTVSAVGTFVQRPTNIDFDAVNSRILVSDFSLDSVVRVNATTGTSTIVSGPTTGTGPRIVLPGPIFKVGNTAYVVDNVTTSAILAVDLTTGARSVVSSSTVGSGPAFNSIQSLGYDTSRNLILAGDTRSGSAVSVVFTVDPATGARTHLSGNGVGTGTGISQPNGIDYDGTNDRYIYADSTLIGAIDPTTGNRTTLSSSGVGAGPALSTVRDMALVSSSSAYVLRTSPTSNVAMAGTLLHVDLTTGFRTAVDLTALGTLPTLRNARTLARDPGTGELFIGDSHAGRIYGVAMGSTTVASALRTVTGDGVRIGSGPEPMFPQKAAYDFVNGVAYVADLRLASVMAIDLDTGARSIVTGGAVGSGTALSFPYSVTIDPANSRLLVVDQALGVVAVDPLTGARTLLYDDTSDFVLSAPEDVMLDAARNRLLISRGNTVPSTIAAMDLTTGVLTQPLSGAAPAPAINIIGPLAHLTSLDRLLTSDWFSLFSVNPVDGSRTQVYTGTPFTVGTTTPLSGLATDGTSAWVVNGQYNSVQRVTLSSGAATTIYDGATGTVPGSSNVGGVGLDAARGLLYWSDAGLRGLTVLDAVTGAKVIISR